LSLLIGSPKDSAATSSESEGIANVVEDAPLLHEHLYRATPHSGNVTGYWALRDMSLYRGAQR
jgi:hypothetical protein